ncbi:cyclic nucleotide-binding domain-containing protein [Nocardioides kribbensis]|uniref:cyclic nucleotide-binding domain-containing protein n=1 Tax=Nocardioides kribbensis TaxID=305517 RepID=UPI00187AB618|nr:cyclic nucleotide-binding domain-containing protein [Nocardioides kribbensis]
MALSNQDLHNHLSAVPLFTGLTKKQRSRLIDAARDVQHHDGHEVAREGAGALALHVVLEGYATVSVGTDKRRTLGPGDYFGEISLLDGRPRSATVVADGPLRTLAVPYVAFQAVLDSEPGVARALLVLLCHRLREAEARN